MTRLRAFLVAALLLAALPLHGDEVPTDPPAYEPFDRKLRLPWKIVRPDAKRWSLDKNKGKLTLTTQKGSIHKDDDKKAGKPKNLFLLNNPYGRYVDFEISVCVSDFKPTEHFQQAGLLLHDGDDDYVKYVWESNGDKNGGTNLVLIRETAGTPEYSRVDPPEHKDKLWLRLTRRKTEYEFAASGNNKNWHIYERVKGGAKGPARVGIVAKNSYTDAPEIDVCFSDFRMRSPAPQDKK